MEKIKAFIAFASETEQLIADAVQRYQSLYVFNLDPQFIRLQLEMEQRAREVGVISIYKRDGYPMVFLKPETFDAIAFSNVEKWQRVYDGTTWNHLKAVEDGVVYETCAKAEIKNASA